MRRIIIFLMLAIIPVPVTCSFAEEMTITTYYPSPNGAYDALNRVAPWHRAQGAVFFFGEALTSPVRRTYSALCLENTDMMNRDYCGICSTISDRRLKKEILPFPPKYGLEAIKRLTPVSFRWRDFNAARWRQTGLIAQDVRKIFPQLVTDRGDVLIKLDDGTLQAVNDAKGINYEGLIVPLIKAVQEQQVQIDELRAELRALKIKSVSRSK